MVLGGINTFIIILFVAKGVKSEFHTQVFSKFLRTNLSLEKNVGI